MVRAKKPPPPVGYRVKSIFRLDVVCKSKSIFIRVKIKFKFQRTDLRRVSLMNVENLQIKDEFYLFFKQES